MKNQPLSSGEQALVLTSIILISILSPLSFVFLPIFFLGLFLTRKNEDFSYLANTLFFLQGLFLVVLAFLFVYGIYMYITVDASGYNYPERDIVFFSIFFALSFTSYLVLRYMLLRPLRRHQEFIEKNGIFASKPNKEKARKAKQIAITQSENLRSYSVADELLKWASLKDAGHISQGEYDEARGKLLQRDH